MNNDSSAPKINGRTLKVQLRKLVYLIENS